jgi:hypothetical protein
MYAAAVEQFPTGQFPPLAGIWICSITGTLACISLAVGLWKYRTSEAPIRVGFLGPLLGTAVVVELALSLIGLVQMLEKVHS